MVGARRHECAVAMLDCSAERDGMDGILLSHGAGTALQAGREGSIDVVHTVEVWQPSRKRACSYVRKTHSASVPSDQTCRAGAHEVLCVLRELKDDDIDTR